MGGLTTKYANGRIPGDRLIKIGSGTDVNGYWEHQITPATLRKWQAALDYARRKWGKVMRISTGWNCYRPIDIQADARKRAEANREPNSAALAGWSSHGGTWVSWKHTGGRWVDAMAIDVVPQQLTWAQVDEAMRHAGFLVGAITKAIAGMDEPWHYIDLDPWAAVPAGSGSGSTTSPEEDDMHSVRINGNIYGLSKQFITHYGDNRQATITRQVTSGTDELHDLGRGDAKSESGKNWASLLDGLGIPRNVLDAQGRVLNPQSGKYEANGTWSREREILAALAKKS